MQVGRMLSGVYAGDVCWCGRGLGSSRQRHYLSRAQTERALRAHEQPRVCAALRFNTGLRKLSIANMATTYFAGNHVTFQANFAYLLKEALRENTT